MKEKKITKLSLVVANTPGEAAAKVNTAPAELDHLVMLLHKLDLLPSINQTVSIHINTLKYTHCSPQLVRYFGECLAFKVTPKSLVQLPAWFCQVSCQSCVNFDSLGCTTTCTHVVHCCAWLLTTCKEQLRVLTHTTT